ncbi:MAG TPA: Abi-like protein, partial [Clostridiales bacterium]|nr:Abi-like protein [Clostridiales bacterium]
FICQNAVNWVKSTDIVSNNVSKNKLSNPVIHDFGALLYIYNDVVRAEPTQNKRVEELKYLFNTTMTRHRDYFMKNTAITSSYDFVKKIIDYTF